MNTYKTFDDLIDEINGVLSSDKTPFGKCFAISDIVKPEIINNIDIPGLHVAEDLKNHLQTT